MTTSRRQFLQTAVAGCSGLALGTAAPAIEPIKRSGKSHIRLSIAGYSYRKYLDLKQKSPAMTYDDFINTAAEMNLDAVEFTAYYFPETTTEHLTRLKGKCSRLGLDVSGTAVGNNFCRSDPAKLKEEIASVKKWAEISSLLGAKTMRIFAGPLEKNDSEEKARARCVEAIQEACDHAARFGVILALENHGGIVATIDQMLALVKAVKHDWFGVNWDTGNFLHDSYPPSAPRTAPKKMPRIAPAAAQPRAIRNIALNPSVSASPTRLLSVRRMKPARSTPGMMPPRAPKITTRAVPYIAPWTAPGVDSDRMPPRPSRTAGPIRPPAPAPRTAPPQTTDIITSSISPLAPLDDMAAVIRPKMAPRAAPPTMPSRVPRVRHIACTVRCDVCWYVASETVPVIGTNSAAAGPDRRGRGADAGATNGPASKGL
jgi:hypothetical protein